MSASTILATRSLSGYSGRALPGRIGVLILALAAPAASPAPPVPRPTPPAARPSSPPARPTDVQRRLDKAEKALGKAEHSLRGRDPGRVTLLLKRIEEELAGFQSASRIDDLVAAIDTARREARGADPKAALASIQAIRVIYPALADYAVVRQAEESSRAALHATQVGDGAGCLEALDRFDASILAPVLLRRIREARDAVARSRTAMVRNDRTGGRAEVAAVRQALDGLKYAGALSRAQFGVRIGSELLDQGALVAARDQVQRALRDLRAAAELGPESQRPEVERARDSVEEVWRRVTRPQDGDSRRLDEAARAIEAIRRHQIDQS